MLQKAKVIALRLNVEWAMRPAVVKVRFIGRVTDRRTLTYRVVRSLSAQRPATASSTNNHTLRYEYY